jgi:dynein light chain roadblock-type
VEEVVNRLSTVPGVEGVVVVNKDGIPVKSTLGDRTQELHYASLLTALNDKVRQTIHTIDETDKLMTIRLRSGKHEIVVVPEGDALLLVIQKPKVL